MFEAGEGYIHSESTTHSKKFLTQVTELRAQLEQAIGAVTAAQAEAAASAASQKADQIFRAGLRK